MKSSTSVRLATFAVAIPALLISGCQSPTAPTADQPVPSTEAATPNPSSEAAAASPTPEAPATEAAPSYTDPSKADTYCGAIEDLVSLSNEANDQNEETIIHLMGTRLDLLVAGTANIGELAPGDSSQDWKAMSADYEEAADLFKASGGQVSNTDFLMLLSKATKTANTTYEHQAETVDEECGIDITKLVAEAK